MSGPGILVICLSPSLTLFSIPYARAHEERLGVRAGGAQGAAECWGSLLARLCYLWEAERVTWGAKGTPCAGMSEGETVMAEQELGRGVGSVRGSAPGWALPVLQGAGQGGHSGSGHWRGLQAPCAHTLRVPGLAEGLGVSPELPHPCCCQGTREVSAGTRWERILQLLGEFVARSG